MNTFNFTILTSKVSSIASRFAAQWIAASQQWITAVLFTCHCQPTSYVPNRATIMSTVLGNNCCIWGKHNIKPLKLEMWNYEWLRRSGVSVSQHWGPHVWKKRFWILLTEWGYISCLPLTRKTNGWIEKVLNRWRTLLMQKILLFFPLTAASELKVGK